MGKNEREENGFSGPENHNQEEEEEEEKKKQLKEVPSWRKQLTVRAFVVSFVLSILFSFIAMKFNLTTGIIPSLSVSAGLLGFFFVKTWTKSGLLRQPKYKSCNLDT